MLSRTVTQIKIDQALVRDANILGDRLEVVDGVTVEPDGDLLLELRRAGVLLGPGEIVLLAHGAPVSNDELQVSWPSWLK